VLLLVFRRALVLLGAVAVLGVAAGCGGSSGSGSGAATVATAPPGGGQVANGPVQTTDTGPGTSTAGPANAHPTRAVVPVLMYHVIAPAPAGAKYAGLWVAPDALQEQVTALSEAGYAGVTLDQVLDAWAGHGTLPEHPVVLSFDDGYLSQGVAAGDILRRAGWPGVLNLAWHNLGTPGGLTAGRVKTMIGDRWEIDAHSLTHPDLTTLDAASLKREVAGSRAKIRQTFGVAADAFCYPAGKYDPAVEAAVRAAGYRAATTEVPGAARPSGDHYALPRIRVDAGVSAASVLSSVRAAVGSGA
jgi:peptidoglycan/xylan/chitin deacetylase (PgdA/CDA1 family)